MISRTQRTLAVIPVVGALALGAAAMPEVLSTSSYGAASDADPLLAGRLLTTDGSPAANVTVTVARRDFSGSSPDTATMTSVPVGSATTDSSGYFTVDALSVDPSSDYEMTGVIDGTEVAYDFEPASSTSTGTSLGRAGVSAPAVAVIKAGVGPLITAQGAPRKLGPRPSAALSNAAAALADPGDGDTLQPPPDGFQDDPDDPSSGPDVSSPPAGYTEVPPPDGVAPKKCGGTPVWGHIKNSTFFKNLPVRGVLTGAHSQQSYTYQTSKQTKAGGELSVAGDNSELGAIHGTNNAWSETLTWPRAKLGNDTTWSLWVEWEYERWQAYCPAAVNGQAVKMDMTESLAWDVSGGSDHDHKATPMGVSCNYTHKIDAQTGLDTAHSESWGGWFAIGGVKLDTVTTQSTKTKTWVLPDNTFSGNNEKDPTYCSTAPTMAGSAWIRETS